MAEGASPERMREAAAKLMRRAKALIPGFVGEVCLDDCELAIGIRAYPQDGKTLAGALPGAEGLYLVAIGGDRFEFRFLVVVLPYFYWLLGD